MRPSPSNVFVNRDPFVCIRFQNYQIRLLKILQSMSEFDRSWKDLSPPPPKKKKVFTVGWVAPLCGSWLSLGKVTCISYVIDFIGRIKLLIRNENKVVVIIDEWGVNSRHWSRIRSKLLSAWEWLMLIDEPYSLLWCFSHSWAWDLREPWKSITGSQASDWSAKKGKKEKRRRRRESVFLYGNKAIVD